MQRCTAFLRFDGPVWWTKPGDPLYRLRAWLGDRVNLRRPLPQTGATDVSARTWTNRVAAACRMALEGGHHIVPVSWNSWSSMRRRAASLKWRLIASGN